MVYDRASYSAADPSAVKNILANDDDVTTRKVTIVSGQNLVAGSVIGGTETGVPAATAGAPFSTVGGSVGNGAVTAVSADAGAMAGRWYIEITGAAGATAAFKVIRPDGQIDGTGNVGTPYNGTGSINASVADGATDYGAGHMIPIDVLYEDGDSAKKYKLSLLAATDGSQVPDLVLAEDADASGGDIEAIAYETATLVSSALTFGTGHTVATVRESLRLKGIKIDDGD